MLCLCCCFMLRCIWIHKPNISPHWIKLVTMIFSQLNAYQRWLVPAKSKHFLNLTIKITLVIIPEGLILVWTLTILMTPLETSFLMKWSFILICSVFSWCVGFLQSCNALELSQEIKTYSCLRPSSANNPLSHMVSLTDSVVTIYSALVVESATTCCRLAFHLTKQPFRKTCGL